MPTALSPASISNAHSSNAQAPTASINRSYLVKFARKVSQSPVCAPIDRQRVGYVRVRAFDQNVDRQLESVVLDKVFIDKASGKDVDRPQLEAMLSFVREGDIVVVHSMDRLARNLDDLRQLVQSLTKRGIRIEFSMESLAFAGKDSPMANLMPSVIGVSAEFERALIRARQREGIAIAEQRGAYRGREKALSEGRVAELMQRVAGGEQKAAIARDLGISHEALYPYLRSGV